MTRWPLAALALILLAGPAEADRAKRLTLPNGLRVVLKPNWSTDVVAIDLLLDVPAQDEPEGRGGIRYLVQRLLLRGNASESGESVTRRLAEVGAIADTTLGLDYVEAYALTPADGFEVALRALADSILRPAFAPEEVEKQRVGAQAAARGAREEPFQETYLAFREALYGPHPYGGLTLGSPNTLASISREDLVIFHRQHYVASRAVVAVCGGVGEARALKAVREAFGDWQEGWPRVKEELPPVLLSCSEAAARERPQRQAHVMIGFPAPAVGGEGYYALQVLDSVLGGGSRARLPRKLREQLGLVYSVSSFYPTLAEESHFGVYAVTEPEHLEAVKAALLEVFADLAERPVPGEELARAKAYLLGSYALSHQRAKEQAYALAWYEILGLGVEFEQQYREGVLAVTPAQMQETARSVFQRFVLAVTLPTT
jgi:predicted Zn-dependent peptidase